MNKEYQKNQKEQKSLLAKYSKYIKKALVGLSFGALAFFGFPYLGVGGLLEGLGLSIGQAATIDVLGRIGLTLGGVITSAYNGIKAATTKRKLNNSMDEEEGLVEAMELS